MTDDHEFSPSDDVRFRGLATPMKATGILLVATGAATGASLAYMMRVASSMPDLPPNMVLIQLGSILLVLLQAAVYFAVGTKSLRSAAAFRRIADTRGLDLDHLRRALSEATGFFRWVALVLGVQLALGFGAFALGLAFMP